MMDTQEPDFYIASSEGYNLEEPRSCYTVKRVRLGHRKDSLLIRIDPPLIGQEYGLGERNVEQVIVAPRHRGTTLIPVSDWPLAVYVALPKVTSIETDAALAPEHYELIAWAELYESEAAARKRLKP